MDRTPGELGLRSGLSLLSSGVCDLIWRGNRGQYPSRSEAAVTVCAEMLQTGYGAAEIWMIMSDPAYGISKHFFSQGAEQAEDWLEQLVSEACEAVNRSEGDDE